jgi:hypothetical protein
MSRETKKIKRMASDDSFGDSEVPRPDPMTALGPQTLKVGRNYLSPSEQATESLQTEGAFESHSQTAYPHRPPWSDNSNTTSTSSCAKSTFSKPTQNKALSAKTM